MRPLITWTQRGTRRAAAFGVCAAVAALFVVVSIVMRSASYNVWAGVIIVPVILALTIPVIVHTARYYGERTVIPLLVAALLLKLIGAVIRYVVTLDVYSAADASTYHRAGAALAAGFRRGFIVDVGGELVGTHFIKVLTGIVYTVTGPTAVGGFLVFSWLGFWGLYFFYRAFRLAVPDGDHRRYAMLIFFLPSLLFWPSSIGKEAWMLFALGVTAFGVARLYVGRRGGYVLLSLGLVALALARPHVGVLVLVALFAGFIVRRGRSSDVLVRTGSKVAGIAILVIIGAIAVSNASSFLGVDNFDSDTLTQTLSNASKRTAEAQSTFSAPNSQSPVGFPIAVITVLFRPFPFETGGVGGLIASAEGVCLMGIVAVSWRRLRTIPGRLFRQPYLMMSLVFTLLFIFAFASFSNFGILTRERTQVFPFFLVLLSVSSPPRRVEAESPLPDSNDSQELGVASATRPGAS
jgi:hypothetical protein